jgi:CBS domain-containing protein/gamma-glutamylcysteine synthetase
MGSQINSKQDSDLQKLQFINALIHDLEALELMIDGNMIESGIYRIGAEQEWCIVNNEWRPANNNLELLKDIDDACFTTELAKYNIELNCDPLLLKSGCFKKMQTGIQSKLQKAQEAAAALQSHIVMAGILPTISRKEITLDYLTPLPRYHFLNEKIRKKRGRQFDLFMKGVDELHVRHDNIMFEACNTSFQTHLQIDPNDFVAAYNWSQAIAAPVLAVSSNSPLLFGKELWSEIRIALFQQSIETRKSVEEIRNERPRVTFGQDWIRKSVTDIYKEDISRMDVLLTIDNPENSLEELLAGKIPLLRALRLHNGTVYRWNRPCYGVNNGVAHLRIENRYLPAGPSVQDEVANMAFWTGLMMGKPECSTDIWNHFSFRDVKSNFFKAARAGIETVFVWQGKEISAKELIRTELIPMAYTGLKKCGISDKEIYLYLGTIEKRLDSNTGAQWQVRNFRRLRERLSPSDAAIALTAATYENQVSRKPICEWRDIEPEKADRYLLTHFTKVFQLMSSDLITVFPDDSLLFVKKIMEWHHIHHMLIEEKDGELAGLITYNAIQELELAGNNLEQCTANMYMKETIHTIEPDAKIEDALEKMRSLFISSLPVVDKGHLVGIITTNDMKRWLTFQGL